MSRVQAHPRRDNILDGLRNVCVQPPVASSWYGDSVFVGLARPLLIRFIRTWCEKNM